MKLIPQTNKSIVGRRSAPRSGDGWMVAYADMITLLFIFFAVLLSMSSIDKVKLERLESVVTDSGATPLDQLEVKLSQLIENRSLENYVELKFTAEGLRMDFNESALFQSGQANLEVRGQEVMGDVASLLGNLEGRYELAIEGHSDSVPIVSNGFRSNFDLSAMRSLNVLHFLLNRGVPSRMVSVRAFADNRPLDKGKTPESLARNRRVGFLFY